MRIKKTFLPCFLSVAAILLCFVFCTPAFSELKMVDESGLAQTMASVTGLPIQSDLNEEKKEECESITDGCYVLPKVDDPWTNFFLSKDEQYAWLLEMHDFITIAFPVDVVYSPVAVITGISDGSFGPFGSNYIRIGLGNQEVVWDTTDTLVTLGDNAARGAGEEQILGSVYLAGLRVKTNEDSYVTLYTSNGPNARMGVGVEVDATLDSVKLDALSWGDADGFMMPVERDPATGKPGFVNSDSTNKNAGYVGLKDMTVDTVIISGPLYLDMETVGSGLNSKFPVGTKNVRMELGNSTTPIDVHVGSLDTTAAIGDKKDFSGTTGILGSLYLKDIYIDDLRGHLNLYNDASQDIVNLDLDVSIPLLKMDTLAWGDPDGVPDMPNLGGVGMRNLEIRNLNLSTLATIDEELVKAVEAKPNESITFLPVGSAYVRLGVDQLDLNLESLTADLALGNSKDNLNQTLGSLYLGELKILMDGKVDIHPPTKSTQGVVLEADADFQKFSLITLSWGDDNLDRIGGTTGPGFVGLKDLVIDGLKVVGRLSIDVATVDAGAAITITSKEAMMYSWYDKKHKMSPSFVHIVLGNGNADITPVKGVASDVLWIKMNTVQADVLVDTVFTINRNRSGKFGSFYVKDADWRINGWVDIGSH